MPAELATPSLFSVATLKLVLVIAFYYKITQVLCRLLSWVTLILRLPLIYIGGLMATLWFVGKLY